MAAATQVSARAGTHAEIAQVWLRDGQLKLIGSVVADGRPAVLAVEQPWQLRLISRERRKLPAPTFADRLKRRLLGTEPPTPATRRFPVTVDGARFEAMITMLDLAIHDPMQREHWDLHLVSQLDGSRLTLRLGGHLDDMPGKQAIIHYPSETVTAGGRQPVEVRIWPYWTDRDDLSIRCTITESAATN